jgi:sugar phosphate isomerase/epimerase
VTVSSLHLPFHEKDDVAAFYETERVKAVDTLSMWMERAAALGAKVVVLHPSARNIDSLVEGFGRFLKQLGRSLNVLIPIAETLGLTISVENMTPGDGIRFGSQPDHFQRFFAEFKHSHFGFCLDTGHAFVSGGEKGPSLMLAAMAPALVAFHLADNAGDRDSHLAPGKGRINWHRLFRDVMALGFNRTMCIEAPPFTAISPKGYAMQAWSQLVHDTETLVEEAMTVPLAKL